MPQTYTELIQRLLDIDGARQAYNDLRTTSFNPTNTRAITWYPQNQSNDPGPSSTNTNNNQSPRVRPTLRRTDQAQAAQANTLPGSNQILWMTQKERDRRLVQNLCLQCSKPGHRSRNCENPYNPNPTVEQAPAHVGFTEELRDEALVDLVIEGDGNLVPLEYNNEPQNDSHRDQSNESGNGEGTQPLSEGEN
ncbi:hypothetical protein V5O48_014841 [Marasmius crinis-equi]|uniref:CCHC-type domain-containing protein n=1 Tax=Marasmius crinis-equi TaxID=585013 RepID=A0ABR3EW84_9AGAR